MASITWSASLSDGTYQGTTWQSYQLYSSSRLPSNAIISNIEYSLESYVGRYGSSVSYVFQLYAIAVENGPYTTTSYSSSSATTLTGSFSASSNSDGSSKYYTLESGSAEVWRQGTSRTYCTLTNCDFKSNLSSTNTFYNNNYINVKLRFNNSGNSDWKQYITGISVKVTYTTASLDDPGTPTFTQSSSTGKCTIEWTAATLTGGTGTIYYSVYGYPSTDGYHTLAEDITTLKLENIRIPAYGSYMVEIVASCVVGGSTLYGYSYSTLDIQPPSTSKPSFSLSPTSGDFTTLSWSNPTISYGEAASYLYIVTYSTSSASGIEYTILQDQPAGPQTVDVPSSWFEGLVTDGDMVVFDLIVIANIKDVVEDSGYESLYSAADSLEFTYDGKSTIAYYNGSKWKECIVYYYTGSKWQECIPYYYNGTDWVELKFKE